MIALCDFGEAFLVLPLLCAAALSAGVLAVVMAEVNLPVIRRGGSDQGLLHQYLLEAHPVLLEQLGEELGSGEHQHDV